MALLEIRERRLYRDGYRTFEDYCQARWGWTRQHAYQLIDAAEVIGDVSNAFDKDALPTSQRQTLELARINEPAERAAVWHEVVTEHGPQAPARLVREAVERRREPARAFSLGSGNASGSRQDAQEGRLAIGDGRGRYTRRVPAITLPPLTADERAQARFGELVRIADITTVTARLVVPHARMAAILAGMPRHLCDALTVAWVYRLGDAKAAQRLSVSTSTVRRRCQEAQEAIGAALYGERWG